MGRLELDTTKQLTLTYYYNSIQSIFTILKHSGLHLFIPLPLKSQKPLIFLSLHNFVFSWMSYNPPTRIPFLYIFGNICYLVFLKIVILIGMKWYLIVSICISLKISDIALAFYVTLERAMATHSSTLAWKTPWTEEPGRLQSMGSLGVRYDWVTSFFSLSCIGEGNGNPLQCSCLENPKDGGA